MPVAEPLLCDDNVRPLLLLGREQEAADVQVADALPAAALHDDDVDGRLCLCDDDRVLFARKRDDVVPVVRVLLQGADIVDVLLGGAAQDEARPLS